MLNQSRTPRRLGPRITFEIDVKRLFLSFAVLHVFAAELTVFIYFDTFCVIALVLHRSVIAAFAIATSQRDDDSVVFLSHFPKLLPVSFFSRGTGSGTLQPKKKAKKNCLPEVASPQYIQPLEILSTKQRQRNQHNRSFPGPQGSSTTYKMS